jgi:hypothetical protein
MQVNTNLSRRNVLLAVGACCIAGLPRPKAEAAAAPPTFPTDEVAPGIHFRRGADEDATKSNDGAIANIGFIVGRDAVAVMDPGGSLIDGQRLRATIQKGTN